MYSNFIWVDLSTFDLERAYAFYQEVFDWEFTEDPSAYTYGSLGETPLIGLYEMPAFFQKIRMPSFWMTYISVKDVKTIAAKAKALGGKVELEEENAKGRIALIRDPAGAGFTCYEGSKLAAKHNPDRAGSWCWTELMVSDLGLVRDFYTTLFDWRIKEDSTDRYGIRTASGQKIGAIQVVSEEVKGTKEFWAVYFTASNLEQVASRIEQAGGKVAGSYPHECGTQMLAYDDQGAAFFLLQSDQQVKTLSSPSYNQRPSKALKWRSLLGLIAIYWIVIFDQNWGWGVLFLFWVIPDLKRGVTYFIEPLSRRSNPLLYWMVVLTWLALSGYLLFDALS